MNLRLSRGFSREPAVKRDPQEIGDRIAALGKRRSVVRTEHRLEGYATLAFRTVERFPGAIPGDIAVNENDWGTRKGTILLDFSAFLQELQNFCCLFAGGFSLVLSPT